MPVPVIIHHKANRDDHEHPPNTLAAIQACLKAGAEWIEIDIMALRDGDYLVAHDESLESETTGTGLVAECTVEAARQLRIRENVRYPVALLSDVVDIWRGFDKGTRLQLDLKSVYPFVSDEPLLRLLDLIKPIRDYVHVSSMADWQLRRLKRVAPWLDVGFEIEFHLALRSPDEKVDPRQPPYRQGAYGFHDDSLLSLARVWSDADYLEDRCDVLSNLVPGISTVYVNHRVLARSLELGFNWAEALEANGIAVSAWTVDADDPAAVKNAIPLRDSGVRRFISNTPLALEQILSR